VARRFGTLQVIDLLLRHRGERIGQASGRTISRAQQRDSGVDNFWDLFEQMYD